MTAAPTTRLLRSRWLGRLAYDEAWDLQRAFWEHKLKDLLATQRQRIGAVCRHIRRLFEAECNDRFQLISRLVAWEQQLA